MAEFSLLLPGQAIVGDDDWDAWVCSLNASNTDERSALEIHIVVCRNAEDEATSAH